MACYLLGLRDPSALLNSPHFPHLFETFVVTDFWKRFHHFGQLPSLYYLRTRDGLEVDLLVEIGDKLNLIEVKSAVTIFPKHADGLVRATRELGKLVHTSVIVSRSPGSFQLPRGIHNCSWKDFLSR